MFFAWPSWKYGARAATPRSGGTRNFAEVSPHAVAAAAHVAEAAGRAVVLLVSASTGNSAQTAFFGSCPMSIMRKTAWPPMFGVLWQVLQVPR